MFDIKDFFPPLVEWKQFYTNVVVLYVLVYDLKTEHLSILVGYDLLEEFILLDYTAFPATHPRCCFGNCCFHSLCNPPCVTASYFSHIIILSSFVKSVALVPIDLSINSGLIQPTPPLLCA